MLHGKLNHLPDLLDLCREAADVLIGDPRSDLLLLGRLIGDIDPRPLANHRSFLGGSDPGGHELYLSAHHRDLNYVPTGDDPPFHIPLKILLPAGDPKGNGGSEKHNLCGSGLSDLQGYFVVDANSSISAGVSIQAHDAMASVLRVSRPDQSRSLLLSLNADYIACLPAHIVQYLRVNPGDAPSHISGTGFNYLKRDISCHQNPPFLFLYSLALSSPE